MILEYKEMLNIRWGPVEIVVLVKSQAEGALDGQSLNN